jgi:hypothetical protein
MSPRGLSRLSPRDGTQQYQYRSSRCASRSYSLCSTSAKAAVAADEEANASKAAAEAATHSAAAAAAEPNVVFGSNGRGLLQPGGLQWAALHTQAAVAIDASNYTVLSVGLDGSLKVGWPLALRVQGHSTHCLDRNWYQC